MGIDLSSSIFVKNMYFDGYGRMDNTWAMLCTFATTKGIVLDVVKDQGVGAIRKRFYRFISRKACPAETASNHGLNFTVEETQNFVGKFGFDWNLYLMKVLFLVDSLKG